MPPDFASRRRTFMERMQGGVAIICGAPERMRSHDVEYVYRPDSDLYYLTGFPEPDAVALLAPDHPEHRFVLFVRPQNPEQEVWTGRRAGVDGAKERHGADAAYPLTDLDERLAAYLGSTEHVHYTLGKYPAFDERFIRLLCHVRAQARTGVNAPDLLLDPAAILHEMRLRKTPEDVALLRRAVDVTIEGQRAAMRATRPGLREFEIQAVLEYIFTRRGALFPGFPTIVASGPNATVLHHVRNDRLMANGDLLLIDAGAEVDLHAGDLTRTIPVSGRYSAEQRAIYDIVLAAQKKAIEVVRPGVPWSAYHDAAVRVLVEGMIEIGLLAGTVDEVIEKGDYKRYYMHRTGHWLGMDVHDVGRYRTGGEWRPLEPGMVLTVEPGIYIAEDATEAPVPFRGIGIRIEDDILVTADGHEVLSAACPKEPAEVEAEMARALDLPR